ncbi:adenylate cyclase [Enterocloster clostridioformis]|uniref:adenylate cyclase n=1 Tax=Enterocloster clostridioformis TaxID=1531 RepID=UPI001C3DE256|nr:adenylate cyclase [Enterocloster clostridioformis]
MNQNIRSTNVRFNLDKDLQNKAWQYLQTMDKQKFKSYSNVIAVSLVDYFDRYYRSQDDPYFETREREEKFVSQIVNSVEHAMEKTLPVFLAGCMAGLSKVPPVAVPYDPPSDPDEDVDWDFLGE